MDAARELAQLAQRGGSSSRARSSRRAADVGVALQLALGQAELERQGDEPLLGAVVQVALEAAALEGRDVEQPGAGTLELLDAGPQLGLQALVVERQAGGPGDHADELGLLDQRLLVDDGADERAVALPARAGPDLGDGAPDPGPGSSTGRPSAVTYARPTRARRAGRGWGRRARRPARRAARRAGRGR